ncbi:hypothetical protein [Mesorhizobium sp. CAU 1741]|uniref:hypothetical protein n=1 Tax=Mesorhizobium sp. CAU 1741 TaxID=3140366 RepID=UPI00325A5B4D
MPAALLEECANLVEIPDRDLRTTEVARLWGADRAALGECRRRHSALVGSVKAIQTQGR